MPEMTLRDWFAGQALNGFVTVAGHRGFSAEAAAYFSYEFADAMLKAREKDTQGSK